MASQRFQRLKVFAYSTAVIGLAILLIALPATTGQSARSRDSADPWTSQQTIEPATLAKELSERGPHPVVVCVGFRTLFEGAHVPGASFHGPAMDAKGLADLKKFAQPLPRSTDLVVYCGCCPLAHCPNIRPAFEALRAMGFTHLKVLLLSHDFAHDWVQAGYPIAKGK
ncbi:MAG: rhodanese-like domain-containing protein [Candidatus Acidiferrales bacterium]